MIHCLKSHKEDTWHRDRKTKRRRRKKLNLSPVIIQAFRNTISTVCARFEQSVSFVMDFAHPLTRIGNYLHVVDFYYRHSVYCRVVVARLSTYLDFVRSLKNYFNLFVR